MKMILFLKEITMVSIVRFDVLIERMVAKHDLKKNSLLMWDMLEVNDEQKRLL